MNTELIWHGSFKNGEIDKCCTYLEYNINYLIRVDGTNVSNRLHPWIKSNAGVLLMCLRRMTYLLHMFEASYNILAITFRFQCVCETSDILYGFDLTKIPQVNSYTTVNIILWLLQRPTYIMHGLLPSRPHGFIPHFHQLITEWCASLLLGCLLPVPMINIDMGHETGLSARFMGPTWGPSGADRTQVGPMLASWTLLSGIDFEMTSRLFDAPLVTRSRSSQWPVT